MRHSVPRWCARATPHPALRASNCAAVGVVFGLRGLGCRLGSASTSRSIVQPMKLGLESRGRASASRSIRVDADCRPAAAARRGHSMARSRSRHHATSLAVHVLRTARPGSAAAAAAGRCGLGLGWRALRARSCIACRVLTLPVCLPVAPCLVRCACCSGPPAGAGPVVPPLDVTPRSPLPRRVVPCRAGPHPRSIDDSW